MERMGPEVLEKLQVLNIQRMIFGRGTHAVGEAKRSCRCLSWEALPSPFCLPFLARSCCADTRHEIPHRLTESFVVSPRAGAPVETSAKRPRRCTGDPNLRQV